jgi:phosphate starvation-inducible protein PhoH
MSKQRAELKGQIQEGVQDFEYKKNLRKKNSLTKEEFQKSNVHLSEKQQGLYKGIRNSTLTVVHGPAGTSKAQPLNTPILTPNGWVKMGDLKTGDRVISDDGNYTIVTGVYPQGKVDVWELVFSDGTKTECCSDHLWFTQTESDRNNRKWNKTIDGERTRYKSPNEGSVKTTLEIIETLYTKRNSINHTIPITKPVNFNQIDVEIDPYIMGCLLGDGCLRQNVGFTTADKEIIESIDELLNDDMSISKRSEYDYAIIKEPKTRINKVKQYLIKIDIWGKLSYEKFIPDCYKFNSTENRIKLLRGLMDTDGSVSKDGTFVSFTSTSLSLIKDVKELVQSLGGIVTHHAPRNEKYKYKGEIRNGRESYSITIKMNPDINPFSLKRKSDLVKPKSKYKPTRYIVGARLLGKKDSQCIKVSSKSRLYLTNDYIVTHNTYTTCYAALALLADKKIEKIIITKPIQESGENLGFLPGSMEDKLHPYKQSYYTTFCKIIGKVSTDMLFATEEIVFEPLAYMRGSTYDNCIMLLDECFTGDTKVVTKHGIRGSFNYLKIKDIVNMFKSGKEIYVSSWNSKTNILEDKKVTGVFENGIKNITKVYTKDRKNPIKTTRNHPFAVFKDGEIEWVEVDNLKVGDSMCRYKGSNTNNSTIITNDSYDIILGMCLGDSSLLANKQIKKSYRISTNHSIKQYDYMNFKKNIFDEISSYRNSLKSGYTGEEQCGFQTKSINISDEFYNSMYRESKKYISTEIDRWFTERTLAIWYMDDGSVSQSNGAVTFSTNSMSQEEVNVLSSVLMNKFNLDSSIYETSKGIVLCLNRVNALKMFEVISNYIHPSMSYKLNGSISKFDSNLYKISYNKNLSTTDIINIEDCESDYVYNIEVDDNNNYFVENILVHNCQNASIKQLMLWVTRLGKDSKAVMMGDTSQYDVRKKDSGYNDFIGMVAGMEELCMFEFNNVDIVRNKFLIQIADRYDKYRSEQKEF